MIIGCDFPVDFPVKVLSNIYYIESPFIFPSYPSTSAPPKHSGNDIDNCYVKQSADHFSGTLGQLRVQYNRITRTGGLVELPPVATSGHQVPPVLMY